MQALPTTGAIPTLTHQVALNGIRSVLTGSGLNVVVNGFFDTDTVWTKGANWTITGGKAVHATGATATLSQTGIITTSPVEETRTIRREGSMPTSGGTVSVDPTTE